MTTQHQWITFYNKIAENYNDYSFAKNTIAEADFLVEELQLPAGSSILDMGCGTGRHSVELAKRGYVMTGVDISSGMLAQAAKTAAEAGVEVEWVESDATKFTPQKQYDAAVCLCEGAFGLLDVAEDPFEHDSAILRNVYDALKPGATFILTTLNGYAKIRSLTQEDIESGRFDPATMIETNIEVWDVPGGTKEEIKLNERRYLPPELIALLRKIGFTVDHVWGGTAGSWGRRTLLLDEIEMMIVARKA